VEVPAIKRVLSVAAEGGGIDLTQEVGGADRFRVVMMGQTPTFLDESEGGPEIRKDNGWLATWEQALEYFSTWPWPVLVPMDVGPGYADRVLAAITEVMQRKHLSEQCFRRERWIRVCGKGGRPGPLNETS
jgi:hypothetical protein